MSLFQVSLVLLEVSEVELTFVKNVFDLELVTGTHSNI